MKGTLESHSHARLPASHASRCFMMLGAGAYVVRDARHLLAQALRFTPPGPSLTPALTAPCAFPAAVLGTQVRHSSRPRAGSYDPYAFQDFESDIGGMAQPGAAGPGAPALAGMYYAGAPLADRAAAMRGYCVSALGQPLFDLIYGALRRRVATAAATAATHGHHSGGPGGGGGAVAGAGQADEVFRQELQSRLGPSRMQVRC